jgi:hypothetical protein
MQVIKQTAEAAHDADVEPAVVLVARLIDHIEVAAYDPRSQASGADVTQLVEKIALVSMFSRAINIRNPPWLTRPIEWRDTHGDRETTDGDMVGAPEVTTPGNIGTTSDTDGRQVREIVIKSG